MNFDFFFFFFFGLFTNSFVDFSSHLAPCGELPYQVMRELLRRPLVNGFGGCRWMEVFHCGPPISLFFSPLLFFFLLERGIGVN